MSKASNTKRMKMISARAKTIYNKKGYKGDWISATVKASNELKKENKI